MESLMQLMDNELQNINIPNGEEYSSLRKFITKDEKCRKFLKLLLSDDVEMPQQNSPVYYISKGRISHSIVNYLLGRVFSQFSDIYGDINAVLEPVCSTKEDVEKLWLITALYHDIGYLQKEIIDNTLDYKKYNYYLYTDEMYQGDRMHPLHKFSEFYPRSMAYSYEQILDYDVFDRERRMREGETTERLNHGIFGGAYLFNRLMDKAEKASDRDNMLIIKATCMNIAQHNIFKSSSSEIDEQLSAYTSLAMLHKDTDFKINKTSPLLLYLSLIDTVECVKRFSKSCNKKSFLQTESVLTNVKAEVNKNSIKLDYSNLLDKIQEKNLINEENILLNTYKNYINCNIKGLREWTIFNTNIFSDGDIPTKIEITLQ